MGIRSENAKRPYIEGILEGRPREAVKKYTGERYTQHSTGVADSREGVDQRSHGDPPARDSGRRGAL